MARSRHAEDPPQSTDPYLGSRGQRPGLRAPDQEGAAPGPQQQKLSRPGDRGRERLHGGQDLVRQPGSQRPLRAAPVHRLPRLGQELPRPAPAHDRRLPRGHRGRPPLRLRRIEAHPVHSRGHRRSLDADWSASAPRTWSGRCCAGSPPRRWPSTARPCASTRRPRRCTTPTAAACWSTWSRWPSLAGSVCGHYRDLDRDLVLIGVLFHDLGKLLRAGRHAGQRLHPRRAPRRPRGHRARPPDRALRRHRGLPRRPAAAARAHGPLPPGQEGVRLPRRADDPRGPGPPLHRRPRLQDQPAPRRPRSRARHAVPPRPRALRLPAAPAHARADLGDFKNATNVFAGGYSRATSHDTRLRLALDIMDKPYKMVTGFQGTAHLNQAMLRGEVNFTGARCRDSRPR